MKTNLISFHAHLDMRDENTLTRSLDQYLDQDFFSDYEKQCLLFYSWYDMATPKFICDFSFGTELGRFSNMNIRLSIPKDMLMLHQDKPIRRSSVMWMMDQ